MINVKTNKNQYFATRGHFCLVITSKTLKLSGSELDLVDVLCLKSKSSYLLHPLFDAFLRLKWEKVCIPFYIHLIWTFMYTFIVMSYSLQRFSLLKGLVPHIFESCNIIESAMYILFPETIIERIFSFIMALLVISEIIRNSRRSFAFPSKLSIAVKTFIIFLWHFSHPTLIGVLLYGDLDEWTARTVASVLMFFSALFNVGTLSGLPAFGFQIFMIKRVAVSVIKFFITFGIIFLSFCLVFHTLMPQSDNFRQLDTAFMKVLSMLMGELDFTNSFVKSGEAGLTAKIFFIIFIVALVLIFMNLLLGIAVSDIHELERVSQSQSAIINSYSIRSMESIITMIRSSLSNYTY